jgi:hypothetical protein
VPAEQKKSKIGSVRTVGLANQKLFQKKERHKCPVLTGLGHHHDEGSMSPMDYENPGYGSRNLNRAKSKKIVVPGSKEVRKTAISTLVENSTQLNSTQLNSAEKLERSPFSSFFALCIVKKTAPSTDVPSARASAQSCASRDCLAHDVKTCRCTNPCNSTCLQELRAKRMRLIRMTRAIRKAYKDGSLARLCETAKEKWVSAPPLHP